MALSPQEFKNYKQQLLAQWTPQIALENSIDRVSTDLRELSDFFDRLNNPDSPKHQRLKTSILNLD